MQNFPNVSSSLQTVQKVLKEMKVTTEWTPVTANVIFINDDAFPLCKAAFRERKKLVLLVMV